MHLLLLLSFLLMLVGCSGSHGRYRDEMKWDMLMVQVLIGAAKHEGNGKMPSGVEGLKKYMSEDILPRMVDTIQSGAIVINWNSESSAKWEAYEKDAPTKGGYAILSSNHFKSKKCTAEEVKAALEK